jgi:hypothetical protein
MPNAFRLGQAADLCRRCGCPGPPGICRTRRRCAARHLARESHTATGFFRYFSARNICSPPAPGRGAEIGLAFDQHQRRDDLAHVGDGGPPREIHRVKSAVLTRISVLDQIAELVAVAGAAARIVSGSVRLSLANNSSLMWVRRSRRVDARWAGAPDAARRREPCHDNRSGR